jgi:hypothetical protein
MDSEGKAETNKVKTSDPSPGKPTKSRSCMGKTYIVSIIRRRLAPYVRWVVMGKGRKRREG